MSTTSDVLPPDAPAPRLCHLVKIASFEGYGFNLHAEKSKPGQFIGKVDPHSPAELAGMLEGDRIVEVNGVNIANENHKQVVERIKSVPDETKLLVVDSAADAWYKDRKIVPRGTQDNVRYIRTPADGVQQPNGHHHEETTAANGDVIRKESETVELPPDAPAPRLCQMKKWEDFEGYGFNLHAEKDKLGQYVGKIDEGSPAEYAGLREGDRIVEVNGVNITSETHRQIVERIKKVPNETNLLVVSLEAEKWYRDHKIAVTGSQANVVQLRNPALNPATAGDREAEERHAEEDAVLADAPTPVLRRQSLSEEDNEKVTERTTTLSSFVVQRQDEPDGVEDRAPALPSSPPPDDTEPEVPETREETPTPKETLPEAVKTEVIKTEVVKTEVVKPDEPKPKPEPPKLPQAKPVEPPRVPTEANGGASTMATTTTSEAKGASNGSLNLNMSASEMRQLLAQRKKHDPKKVQMDLKKKYELIEQM